MRFLKSAIWFVVLSALATVAIWYFFGEIRVTSSVDGYTRRGFSVLIDGKEVCKTPCRFKPLPGFHTVLVSAPEDEGVEQAHRTFAVFTGNVGATMNADFTTPLYLAAEPTLLADNSDDDVTATEEDLDSEAVNEDSEHVHDAEGGGIGEDAAE